MLKVDKDEVVRDTSEAKKYEPYYDYKKILEKLQKRVDILESRQDPTKYNLSNECEHRWNTFKSGVGEIKVCKKCGFVD